MLQKIPQPQLPWPLSNLLRSWSDNQPARCIAEPAVGGIVCCELLFDLASHTGIYVGNGNVVHLDGDGRVLCSSAHIFRERLDGFNSAISVYTDCLNMTPQGCQKVADRAKAETGKRYPYHLLDFNCHRFTARCLTGTSAPDVWLFAQIEALQQGNGWRVWQ